MIEPILKLKHEIGGALKKYIYHLVFRVWMGELTYFCLVSCVVATCGDSWPRSHFVESEFFILAFQQTKYRVRNHGLTTLWTDRTSLIQSRSTLRWTVNVVYSSIACMRGRREYSVLPEDRVPLRARHWYTPPVSQISEYNHRQEYKYTS